MSEGTLELDNADVKTQERPLVETASAILKSSIREFATSTAAASLNFTLHCRERNYDPQEFIQLITSNPNAIQELTDTANLIHHHMLEQREADPAMNQDTIRIPHTVTTEEMGQLVGDISYYVNLLPIVSDDDLKEGLAQYEKYSNVKKDGTRIRDEMGYGRFVERMVENRQIQNTKQERRDRKEERRREKAQSPQRRPLSKPTGRHARRNDTPQLMKQQ